MINWTHWKRLSGPAIIVPLVALLAAGWLTASRLGYERKARLADAQLSSDGSDKGTSRFDPLQLLELNLFDWRVTLAKERQQAENQDLAFVAIQDGTVERLRWGFPLDETYGLLFPRLLYGRILRALAAEEVKLVAFDVALNEERPDHPPVENENGTTVTSDGFFVGQIMASQRAVLASPVGGSPAGIFRSSGAILGAVDRTLDSDGVTRRVPVFIDQKLISLPLLRQAENKGVEVRWNGKKEVEFINYFEFETNSLPLADDGSVVIGLGKTNAITDLSKGRLQVPALVPYRTWNMGIVMAAARLGLDLESAKTSPGVVEIPGTNGVSIKLPVDSSNNLLVNWSLDVTNVQYRSFEDVLLNDRYRQSNRVADIPNTWKDRVVLLGSTVSSGNNLTDRGATPLDPHDTLAAIYLNVADSVIHGRFITRPAIWQDALIAVVLAILGGVITWKLRTSFAILTVLGLAAIYSALAVGLFLNGQLWIPLAHPLAAGLLLSHVSILAYRTVFEQRERQRVRSVFAKIVSPDVVQELLGAERLGLGGARREVTVFFADVRGFTEMTDKVQAAAEEHVQARQLPPVEAEAYFDAQSAELLATVNLYLAAIADVIKAHGGTLDKYIGDCVMAFWGAPTPNALHAVKGVMAAIDAQRAIQKLNEARAAENAQREAENPARIARGEPPLPLHSLLALGTGINTGTVTVGLMGSDAHILNYTVFGREVNLASRLEGVSGRSRIIIGEGTYRALERHAHETVGRCRQLEPVTVKGFRQSVTVYEVAWHETTGGS